MNKTLIFRKIGGIISELTEQYQYLAESPENINPLELELFIANSHFLAEHLAILKKLDNSPELLNQSNSVTTVKAEDTVVAAPKAESAPVFDPDPHKAVELRDDALSVTPEARAQTEWFKPIQVDEVPANTPEQPVKTDTFEPAEIVPVVSAPQSEEYHVSDVSESIQLSDQPESEKPHIQETENERGPVPEKVPTLNELLSERKNKDNIAAKIVHQEERDLKSMIKLNDKLMFVRDLFGGYNLAYSEAIELVNRFETFEAAENFLKQNYALKNKWSEKQSTVDQFYEILNRRFS